MANNNKNNNNNSEILDSNNGETTCPVRAALKSSIYHRQASLTPVEKTFLSALLIDKQQQPNNTAEEEEIHKRYIKNATRVLMIYYSLYQLWTIVEQKMKLKLP